jgi:hypothetical protein
LTIPTKRSVNSIRESPAGNIPGWSYPNRLDPPAQRSEHRLCFRPVNKMG